MAVAFSGDLLVVGAEGEDSKATGINGNQADNAAPVARAAYLFTGVDPPPLIAITSVLREGQNIILNFTSSPGLAGWQIQGTANLTSWPDDRTADTTFSEISPGLYRAAVDLGGTPPPNYFLRIRR